MKTLYTKEYTLLKTTTIPIDLEENILYYSSEYMCSQHLCPCGCKTKTPLDHRKNGWKIEIENVKFTISPSVRQKLNCSTHYVIKNSIFKILEK